MRSLKGAYLGPNGSTVVELAIRHHYTEPAKETVEVVHMAFEKDGAGVFQYKGNLQGFVPETKTSVPTCFWWFLQNHQDGFVPFREAEQSLEMAYIAPDKGNKETLRKGCVHTYADGKQAFEIFPVSFEKEMLDNLREQGILKTKFVHWCGRY